MLKKDAHKILLAIPGDDQDKYANALQSPDLIPVFLPADEDVVTHFVHNDCRVLIMDIDPLSAQLFELLLAFLDRIEVLPPIIFLTSDLSREDISGVLKFDEVEVFLKDPDYNYLRILPHLISKAFRRYIFQMEIERKDFELQKQNETMSKENAVLYTAMGALDFPFFVINVEDYSVDMTNRHDLTDNFTEPSHCYQLINDLSIPCGSSGLECTIDTIRTTGKEVILEHSVNDSTGKPHIIEIRGIPVYDSNNQLVQVIEFIKDKSAK
ncbi:MAG: hypothetical protein A2Y33_03545 [Spirochaetes bacterium GWF1_51_8]|nr:MAG: hypothetical protein A2Y33_03545 [Spirochaetes bacterium GWF1_51_8]